MFEKNLVVKIYENRVVIRYLRGFFVVILVNKGKYFKLYINIEIRVINIEIEIL